MKMENEHRLKISSTKIYTACACFLRVLHDLKVFVNVDDKRIKGLGELIAGQVKHDFDPEEKVILWCVLFPIRAKTKK